MGNICLNSGDKKNVNNNHHENIHVVIPEIKIHTVVSTELDHNHEASMRIPLGEVSDEQLLAEVARRKLDLHENITDAIVKQSYDIGKELGHGASGVVYLATHKVSGIQYACKVVKKDANMNDAESMSTEIEIMKRIRHRHVVSMYELFETPKCLWIFLELITGGDLNNFLSKIQLYTEVHAARHLKQMMQGIHYLHSLGIVHRDLKLDNIILGGTPPDMDVKIADYGLSAKVRLGEGYDLDESTKRKTYRGLREMWGTKEYFAPELIDQAYGPQVDVWSVGCIMYEVLSGHQAFGMRHGDDADTFYDRIKHKDYDMARPVWKKISIEAHDLLSKLLVVDPNKRLSASEALLHPWVTGSCHTNDHRQHLCDSQEVIRAKLEEKRRRREAQQANHRK